MDSFKNDCHSADGANPALLGDHSVDFEKIFASFLFLEFFQHLSILKENKTKSRRVIQVNAVHLDDNRGQWWWYQKKISYWTCLVLVDIRNGFQPAFIDRLGENTSVRNSWSMTYLLYSILFFEYYQEKSTFSDCPLKKPFFWGFEKLLASWSYPVWSCFICHSLFKNKKSQWCHYFWAKRDVGVVWEQLNTSFVIYQFQIQTTDLKANHECVKQFDFRLCLYFHTTKFICCVTISGGKTIDSMKFENFIWTKIFRWLLP